MPQELTADERWLLEQIRAGKPAVFATETVIDPTVLRVPMLGLVEESQGSAGSVAGPCVIHKAEFWGPFDLSDGRQASGGSLPAIEFVECRFHAGFCADGADLDRLAFKRCFFVADETAEPPASFTGASSGESSAIGKENIGGGVADAPAETAGSEPSFQRRVVKNKISLRNCRIRTELRLEDLRPNDFDGRPGTLLVDGFAAVIGTNVVVTNTLLRAPQGEPSTTLPEPRYALDLSTAEIGSDVQLMPSVRLLGGLKMRDARVGGTVWAAGLEVSDGETEATREAIKQSGSTPRAALRLETTAIKGNLVFGTDESGLLQEAIRFAALRAKESAPAKFELRPVVLPYLFKIDGGANLQSASVDGSLDISQGIVNGPLQMQGLTVKGSLTASQALNEETKRILRPDPKESTNFPLTVKGSMWLNNSRIDGDVWLEISAQGLDVSGAELKGFVVLKGPVANFLAFGMRTANDVTLAFKGLYQCGLQGARVGGRLDVRQSEFWPKAALNLSNCEIHQAMEFADPVGTVVAVNRSSLSCYPGFALTEVLLLDQGRHAIAAYLTLGRRSEVRESTFLPLLLNGRSEHLHTLNAGHLKLATHHGSREKSVRIAAPLELDTAGKAREYLRLFCAYVWGEYGSFSLVTNSRDLPAAVTGDPEILKIPCTSIRTEEGKDAWEAKAYVRYAENVFVAVFHVFKDMSPVEMKDDEPFGEYEGHELAVLSNFEAPYRIPPIPEGGADKLIASYRSDFHGWTKFSSDPADIARFKREAMWWQTLLKGFAGMQVNLNGASCRLLKDNAAFVWKRSGKLEMESFDYRQVSIPESGDYVDEVGTRLDMVRGELERPERMWTSLRYFLLTLLSLPLLPAIVFLVARRWRWKTSGFRAEPYTHLAQVLRERGDDEAAREVEAEKIWQGAVDRGRATWGGKLWEIYWWRPYGVMFRYGLSPLRAAASVLAIWVLGWIAVSVLSHHHMLQADVMKVAPAAQVSPGQPTMIALQGTPGMIPNLPCDDAIEPGLYSFELLTPIINLHQESRCDVRNDPYAEHGPTVFHHQWHGLGFLTRATFWEYAKALYMLVGSIISSLAILTFSGIARRWEH